MVDWFIGGGGHTVWFDTGVHFGTTYRGIGVFSAGFMATYCRVCQSARWEYRWILPLTGTNRENTPLRWYAGRCRLAIAGLLVYAYFSVISSVSVVAFALICSGSTLFILDYCARKNIIQLSPPLILRGICIGLFQVCALIPGVSRSGITLAGGRLVGFSREEAARFSFLLGIPAIGGAVLLIITDAVFGSVLSPGTLEIMHLLVGVAVAFAVAIVTIHLFLRFVEQIGFLPFFIYQVLLGIVLLMFV